MAIQAHIRELTARHARLDQAIQKEQKSPAASDLEILALKRQKLKLKEQLEGLRAPH